MIFIFGYLLPLLIILGCGYITFKAEGTITHGQIGAIVFCSLIPFANVIFSIWGIMFVLLELFNGRYFNGRIKL